MSDGVRAASTTDCSGSDDTWITVSFVCSLDCIASGICSDCLTHFLRRDYLART